MNELALFAGAGGGILGGIISGRTTVCAVEINHHCRSVLLARQRDGILPLFPIWDDIETFDGTSWRGVIDVISGGFPCQPFSTASRGRRVARDMWPEMLRITKEVQLRFVFCENVALQPIKQAKKDLESAGFYVVTAQVSASDVGADHIRTRHWLLAHTDNEGQLCGKFNAEVVIRPHFCTSFWQTPPHKTGMDDGLASRVDRYKAIGNGQVPAVVKAAWDILMMQIQEKKP